MHKKWNNKVILLGTFKILYSIKISNKTAKNSRKYRATDHKIKEKTTMFLKWRVEPGSQEFLFGFNWTVSREMFPVLTYKVLL